MPRGLGDSPLGRKRGNQNKNGDADEPSSVGAATQVSPSKVQADPASYNDVFFQRKDGQGGVIIDDNNAALDDSPLSIEETVQENKTSLDLVNGDHSQGSGEKPSVFRKLFGRLWK